MDRPVTLDDVARVAGVSRAAASRALNGRDGVRPDVRERVEVVARSMGYQPNRAARNLASGRSSILGLVIPSDELRVDPYGASMVHAVSRAAAEADHSLMLFLTSDEPGENVRTNLRDGLLDGVIVSAVAVGEAWVEKLLDTATPTVLVGSHPRRSDVPVVDTENRLAAAEVVEHLFDQGCRRVAIVTGRPGRVDAMQRLEGWRLAHERRGYEIDDDLVIPGDFSRASGRAAGQALLALEGRVDGVFASNDEMALGVLSTLTRAGVRVPEDVAVAGFDGTSAADLEDVSLTTTAQPFAELGRSAVADLLALLAGEDVELYRTFAPELIIGSSSLRSGVDPLVRHPP